VAAPPITKATKTTKTKTTTTTEAYETAWKTYKDIQENRDLGRAGQRWGRPFRVTQPPPPAEEEEEVNAAAPAKKTGKFKKSRYLPPKDIF
jgi:hypothetical protein